MAALAVHWQAPLVAVSDGSRFPVRHVWCVGRNYAEHAREMGADPERSEPVFFSKPAQAVIQSERIAYPADTASLHHEVELVVFLSGGGRNLTPAACAANVFGYAVGVDLTRRDIQARAKERGQPWEMSKGFDQSAPVGLVTPAADWSPEPSCGIELSVDGQRRQQARLGEMIWAVSDLLATLSQTVTLNAGDVVFTGAPAGVGALHPGARVRAQIEGLPTLEFQLEGN